MSLIKKFLEADLFKPESYMLFYLIYIGITIASFFSGLPIKKPGILGFLIIFGTFPLFLLGVKFGEKIWGRKVPELLNYIYIALVGIFYALVFANFYKFNLYLALVLCVGGFVLLYFVFLKNSELFTGSIKVPSLFMLIGTLFLIFSFIQENGIPLLNPPLRVHFLYNTSFGIAMLIFVLGFVLLMPQIKDEKKYYLILIASTAIFFLATLRGTILTVFLTGTFIAYYAKKLTNKKIFVAIVAAVLIVLFVGYLARPILNPGSLFLYRAGTTHVVFDNIVNKSMPFGYTHGTLFFQGNPRDFVGSAIMGKTANLTYTVLGEPVLDFGIIGATVWMFLLGFVLKIAHSSMKTKGFEGFYPLLFTLSLLFLEMGSDQFFLLFFFIFFLFYLAKNKKQV